MKNLNDLVLMTARFSLHTACDTTVLLAIAAIEGSAQADGQRQGADPAGPGHHAVRQEHNSAGAALLS